MWASGLVVYSHNKDWKSTDRCRVDKPPETKTRVLTLTDFSPAFLILGFGLLLSGFVFVMEVLSKYVSKYASALRSRERNINDSKPITQDLGEK